MGPHHKNSFIWGHKALHEEKLHPTSRTNNQQNSSVLEEDRRPSREALRMEKDADEPNGWRKDAVIETKDVDMPDTDNENGIGINIKEKCNITYCMDTAM